MKNSVGIGVSFSLAVLFMFGVFGCTPSFPAVSDQEIIKAINESKFFVGTGERFILKSPIQILGKSRDDQAKAWLVVALMTVTFKRVDGKETPAIPSVMSIKKCHFDRREKSKISQSRRLLRNGKVSLTVH